MSELQKYWGHNDQMEVDLSRIRGIECNNVDPYYRCDEVDARLALMQKQMAEMRDMHAVSIADADDRLALMQRAVEWSLMRGAWRCRNGRIRSISNGDEEVPADLADIISPGIGK